MMKLNEQLMQSFPVVEERMTLSGILGIFLCQVDRLQPSHYRSSRKQEEVLGLQNDLAW